MSDSTGNLYTPEALAHEAETSSCTGFVIFNDICHEKGADVPYCFVEGYDEGYYSPVVYSISRRRGVFIPCGGKEGVIASHDMFKARPEYDGYTKLYFVDRDYDDNSGLPCDEICVTEGYSVENYYCSEDCLEAFLSTICGMTHERGEEKRNTMNLYREMSDRFYVATLPFCSWYANLRVSMRRNPVVDDYETSFPEEWVKMEYKTGLTVNEYGLDDLNEKYGLEEPVGVEEYEKKRDTIKSLMDIRGKFVLQFVNFFLQYIRITAQKPGGPIRKKFGFEENQKTILTRLSACADRPASLLSYISQRIARLN